jgi:glycosyltransferase involved in cell wall biosynthesis
MSASSRGENLLIIGTHPVQYHAPVYRMLESKWGVPVRMIYASDFSAAGYYDKDFQTRFVWDVDLFTEPDHCVFLSKSSEGGATCLDEISADGLRDAMAAEAPAAVLLTGYGLSFLRHAFYHAVRLGYRILFRAETVDRPPGEGGASDWLRNLVLRRMYARCSGLLPIGERSYRHYRQLGCPDEKLVYSRYCVNTAPFRCGEDARTELRTASRQSMNVSDDQVVLLYSGKLQARKRPRLLAEAVKRLPPGERSRIVIVFLGNGAEREAIQADIAQDPAIPAIFPGFKNQTELSPYYHAADLLVLPSAYETWGLVVNEALHHGVPVVVTDTVGCAPDLVRPGITGEIAGGNPQSLSQALLRALRLTGRDETRDNCRRVIGEYTVEKAAKGIRDAFHQFIRPVSPR